MGDYDRTPDGVVISNDLKIRRAQYKYRALLPIERGKLSEEHKKMLNSLDGRMRLILSKEDLMKEAFVYQLMRLEKLVDVEVMSVYRLIDIYLGADKLYESILGIRSPYLLLYMGYSEFENKRQGDAIMQIIDEYKVMGRSVWLYYKGSEQELVSKYSNLRVFLERNKFQKINLDAQSLEEEI